MEEKEVDHVFEFGYALGKAECNSERENISGLSYLNNVTTKMQHIEDQSILNHQTCEEINDLIERAKESLEKED